MSRARILILLVAIVSAALAVIMFRGLLNREPPAPVVVEAPKVETVPVLVATKELVMGERLVSMSVEWRDWPRSNLADYMITQEARPDAIKEIEGSRARATILPGEPIAERNILAAKDGNLMSSLIRPGLRAFAIRISDRTGGGGFILPNDRVDIIASFRAKVDDRSGEDDKEVVFSSAIITNVRVLAINQSLAPDGDSASMKDLQTAVLELELSQAEIVARSEAQGELSLALRALGESIDKDAADDRPTLAALTRAPNSVEMFRQGVRFIYSCDPGCDPVLQMGNAPFPLIVKDDGAVDASGNR